VVIFDIQPEHGNRISDGRLSGRITSDDDFWGELRGHDDYGKTTITQLRMGSEWEARVHAFAQGAAVRNNIEDYVRIIKEGNNGGYANDCSSATGRRGRIAYLEWG